MGRGASRPIRGRVVGDGAQRRQGRRGGGDAGQVQAAGVGNVRRGFRKARLASPGTAPGAWGLSMAAMSMIQALNSALDVMLERDPDVLMFGEDIGYFGGVFRVTEGLQKKYGLKRCFDTPISEGGI